MNLSNFSDEDLQALKDNRFGDMSTEGLKALRANYMSRTGETAFQKSIDPTAGMTPGEKRLAGAGSVMSDMVLGVKQRAGNATPQDVQDKRNLDAPLMATKEGKQGAFGGSVALGTGLSLLPGANTLGGAALYGGLYGLTEPTAPNENVTSNVLRNSALNAGGLAAGRLLFGGLAGNSNTPARQGLVDAAVNKYDIPLPASTRTGNTTLGYLESTLAGLPTGGKMADAIQNAKQAHTARIMEQAGAPAGAQATVEEAKAAQRALQGDYESLWSRNAVNVDGQFVRDLIGAKNLAARSLTPEKARIVDKQIENILTKVNNNQIPGDTYQMFLRPEIRGVAAGDSSLKEPLKMVQRALDDVANRSLSGADAATLAKLNQQYAVGKTLKDVIPKAEARGGTIAPNEALSRLGSFGGDVGELGRIGPLLRDLPNSGTQQRLLAQTLLTGGAGGIGYLAGGPEGALYGSLIGLGGPAVAAQILGSRLGQNALSRGLVPVGAPYANALSNAVRPLVLGAPAAAALLPSP